MDCSIFIFATTLPQVPAHHYNTAGRIEGGVQSLLNMAYNTSENNSHMLGLRKEILCCPGQEPTPGLHD